MAAQADRAWAVISLGLMAKGPECPQGLNGGSGNVCAVVVLLVKVFCLIWLIAKKSSLSPVMMVLFALRLLYHADIADARIVVLIASQVIRRVGMRHREGAVY